jgi:hypothetical protein
MNVGEKPEFIDLEEAEAIALSVLTPRIRELKSQLSPLEKSLEKILAKVASRANVELAVIETEYQQDGKRLARPTGN